MQSLLGCAWRRPIRVSKHNQQNSVPDGGSFRLCRNVKPSLWVPAQTALQLP